MQDEKKTTPIQSILAGSAAGGIESLVTYPTEYVKTRKQLGRSTASPFRILLDVLKESGPRGLYTGAGAFCISNASKSGVRFLTFDTVKNLFPRDPVTNKTNTFATVVAGLAAGVAESVTFVTPGENLKTKLVQDAAGPRQFASNSQALRYIVATDGIRGFFRGVVPVTLKQSANALVRFTSYSLLLDAIKPSFESAGSAGLAPTVAGATAGVITVYATMPFDVIKTKMQSLGDSSTGTLHCLRETVQQSGIKGLWKGTTPRLVRLSISGAISFTVYEQTLRLIKSRPKTTIAEQAVA